MSVYTKEDISAVLHTAELLNKKGSGQKINVSEFCLEAGISRKNAYKHKNNINVSVDSLEDKVRELENEKEQIEHKLVLAENRAREADLYWQCRCILVELNRDYKKNGPGRTKRRLELIETYNKIGDSLGFEPLSCWE
ncbi:MAG: hypothetical protein JSW06_03865 [Thermoplasmatales archaeon]|nr:MAG: hypothetical protein JSW06_03865 [Thermoplasmatales archaeon]